MSHEIHSRREAELEATLRERNRLAGNLHDTLLQTIGVIRFQLDACRVAGRGLDEAEVGEHFDVTQRMIDHAVQEAIHNAIRHGRPTRIDVASDFGNDGELTLTVRDDGAGFLPGTEVGPGQGHFGLVGMRERVERLGGTIEIESAPGAGTTITAHVHQPAETRQAEHVG